MTDKQIVPASYIPTHRIAEIFYEMHTLCENDLSLSMRQRNLVSLGYLLYGSEDNILLITTLKWVNPELIIEVHQLMLQVCDKALLLIAERGCKLSVPTLQDYNACTRLIAQKYRLLRANS